MSPFMHICNMYPQSSYYNILSMVYNICIAMFTYAIEFKCEGIIACHFFLEHKQQSPY
jgi:hypothetical protein